MVADFDIKYSMEQEGAAFRFRFYCELSGLIVYETELIKAIDEGIALNLAKTAVRQYFNRCSRCGRWISDMMYNMDEMQCIQCSPRNTGSKYCTKCGSPILMNNQYCIRCGHKTVE